jgi:hypothetical protein
VGSGHVEMADVKKQQQILKFCMKPGNTHSEICEVDWWVKT